MRIIVLLTGITITCFGCVHSRVINETTPPDTLARLNQEYGNRSGRIKLQSEHVINARSILFDSDSLHYLRHRNEAQEALPIRNVDRVTFRDRRIGIREGIVSGAIGGAIAGAILGTFGFLLQQEPTYARSDPPDSSGYFWGSGGDRKRPILECVGIGMLAGAVPGAAVGLFIGATGGSFIEVRFRYKSQ